MGLLGGIADAMSGIKGFVNDPVPKFFFGVMVMENPLGGGIMGAATAAVGMASQLDPAATAFKSVSGLSLGVGTKDVQEAGNNIPVYLPDKMNNEELTLKRYVRPRHIGVMGFSADPMTGWCQKTAQAAKSWSEQIITKDVIIMVYHPHIKNPLPVGPAAFPITGYIAIGAWPVKWEIDELQSEESAALEETIILRYRELQRLSIPPA